MKVLWNNIPLPCSYSTSTSCPNIWDHQLHKVARILPLKIQNYLGLNFEPFFWVHPYRVTHQGFLNSPIMFIVRQVVVDDMHRGGCSKLAFESFAVALLPCVCYVYASWNSFIICLAIMMMIIPALLTFHSGQNIDKIEAP